MREEQFQVKIDPIGAISSKKWQKTREIDPIGAKFKIINP